MCKGIPVGSGIPLQESSDSIKLVYEEKYSSRIGFLPQQLSVDFVSSQKWNHLRASILKKQKPDTNDLSIIEEKLIEFANDGASDILLEKGMEQIKIRTRQADGTIQNHYNGKCTSHDIGWLKLKSGMSGTKEEKIEDGHLTLKSSDRLYRFRLSSIQTINGESIVLRHIQSDPKNFPVITFPLQIEKSLQEINGLMLIAGSTGSGKSSTLHHLLSKHRTQNKKVISIEDPIEFVRIHTTQSNINPERNWNFDTALKHFLRADPDIIVVGELRDKSTIQLAVRAALTGHAVYATIHSPRAILVPQRLKHFGISQNLIDETLNWVLHQRLIPKPCPACKSSRSSCALCAGSGIYGREPKFELFENPKRVR